MGTTTRLAGGGRQRVPGAEGVDGDLAAMRDAVDDLGGDAEQVNPLVPVDLVIDHSVQVDAFGNARAFEINADRDYERNRERYAFLRWGQQAFDNFRVVPPATRKRPTRPTISAGPFIAREESH